MGTRVADYYAYAYQLIKSPYEFIKLYVHRFYKIQQIIDSLQPYLNARKLSNMNQSYEEELQQLNDDIVRASQKMNPEFMGRRNAQQTKTSANSPRNERVRESQQALRQSMTQSRLRQRQQDEGKQQLPSLSAIRFVGPKSIAQSVLTTYNKESIARSVGKLVKLTSNDYYKQKLKKNQEQMRKDYIQSTLDNPTYRSGVDASTIDQSELSRPTTLLMLHKQPQVYEKRDIFSFQQQNLLKLAMENPKNAMQAAANVQLSLLKLKQIKDMYRNRYKIDGFTSDQSPALVDQQPLYITQSLI